jgi:hypothetical protein
MFPHQHMVLATNCPLYKHLGLNPNLHARLIKLGLLNAQQQPLTLYRLTGSNFLPGESGKTLYNGNKKMDVSPYTPGFLVWMCIILMSLSTIYDF